MASEISCVTFNQTFSGYNICRSKVNCHFYFLSFLVPVLHNLHVTRVTSVNILIRNIIGRAPRFESLHINRIFKLPFKC